jgi:hypothetical protein
VVQGVNNLYVAASCVASMAPLTGDANLLRKPEITFTFAASRFSGFGSSPLIQ